MPRAWTAWSCQSRRSAALGGAAAKASAGALAHVRIAEVVNIARALEELKEPGVWTVGLAGERRPPTTRLISRCPTALVLGAEGPGLRRLVRERCDFLASIPMAGHVESLNVSVAAGVALFEAVRQRRGRAETCSGRDARLRRLGQDSDCRKALAGLAREVLLSALCLAGVAQSGRAADL